MAPTLPKSLQSEANTPVGLPNVDPSLPEDVYTPPVEDTMEKPIKPKERLPQLSPVEFMQYLKELHPGKYDIKGLDDYDAAKLLVERHPERYGDLVNFGPHLVNENGESKYFQQHPIIRTIEGASDFVQSSSFAAPIRGVGQVLGAGVEAVDSVLNSMRPVQASNLLEGTQGQSVGESLQPVFNQAKKGYRDWQAGIDLEQQIAGRMGGEQGRPGLFANETASRMPFDVARVGVGALDMLTPFSAGETALQVGLGSSKIQALQGKGIKTLASAIEGILNKFSASKLILQRAAGFPEAAAALQARIMKLGKDILEHGNILRDITERLTRRQKILGLEVEAGTKTPLTSNIDAPIKNTKEFGIDAQRELDTRAQVASSEIAVEASVVDKALSTLPSETSTEFISAIKNKKEAFTNLIQEAGDKNVSSVLEKYQALEREETRASGKLILNPTNKEISFLPSQEKIVTVDSIKSTDLVKDRATLGRSQKALLKREGKRTGAYNSLSDLRNLIDDELERRATKSGIPKLLTEAKNVRNSWTGYYDKYYSNEAQAIRSASPSDRFTVMTGSIEAVESAKATMPDAYASAKKGFISDLVNKMQKANDPESVLTAFKESKNAGLLKSIVGPDEEFLIRDQVRLRKQGLLTVEREDALIKELKDNAKIMSAKRKNDPEWINYANRSTDTEIKATKSLHQWSVGGGVLGTLLYAIGGTHLPAIIPSFMGIAAAMAIAPEVLAHAYVYGSRATLQAMNSQYKLGKLAGLAAGRVTGAESRKENANK